MSGLGSSTTVPTTAHSRDATYPFQSHDTDLIIRSNDGVDFHVYKQIMTLASEIFAGMISLPQTTSTPTPQVVGVTENSTTVDMFLRLIYPVQNPRLDSVTRLHAVLEILHKYGVEGQDDVMKYALRDFIKTQPEAVFALADRYGHADIAKEAARLTLGRSDIPGPLALNDEDLQLMTAKQYHQLLQFQTKCRETFVEMSQVPPYWCNPDDIPCSSVQYEEQGIDIYMCQCPRSHHWDEMDGGPGYTFPFWLGDYLARCEDALAKKPTAATVLDWQLVESFWGIPAECEVCRDYAGKAMKDFMDLFAYEIRSRIDKIKV
ncbi:hypothetical protein DENSPDRAFT_835932 [Dentipellis sp. KUC8613]|nr:hypothetical protein DENSPDRAFT_835932 [Dentipellis sp. KUC8613]